ncbi:membrane protein [Francisella halioticida]|uniref:SSD domain-containing protein n=1 Tax=Francisella halioticida TaxID=549298 RepID=A0ABM6M2C2_9GAMM|nr:MMPL family transporter [Francisella halioticida]ASG68894.1 hypothetical protein CDV26_11360 [Francisella halioticida]BCD91884.1 membrane protein [Francisella halioticida]
MKDKYIIRFILWAIAIVISFIIFGLYIARNPNLNTNILALLPSQHSSPTLVSATSKFSNEISDNIIFLVGENNEQKAELAASKFSILLKKSNLFEKINTGISSTQELSWGSFYFPYRLQLLSPKDKDLLTSHNYERIYQNALANIYNPTGIVNRKLLNSDPFFTYQNFLFNLPKPSSKLKLNNSFLIAKKNNKYYVLIKTETKGKSFSLTSQKNLMNVIDTAINDVSRNDIEVLKTGMLFYANAGAQSAHHEVNTIGIGGLIGILLLIIFTFKSIKPFFFTVFSILCGFVAAFVVTHYIFGSVFLFTLVFGASLIGVSVDYAFFFYSEMLLAGKNSCSKKGLDKILSGITLALINIIIAFIIIGLVPFPGLRQLAIFAITGLSVSYFTVVCFFPYALSKVKYPAKHPILLHLSNGYLSFWKNLSIKICFVIFFSILILAMVGVYKTHSNDDIHILQPTSEKLIKQEAYIKQVIGSNIGLNYIIVLANSNKELIEKAHRTSSIIRKNFTNINHPLISISDYIPSINQQKENYDETKKLIHSKYMQQYLNKVGFTKAQQEQLVTNLNEISFSPLTLSHWLNNPISKQTSFLYLGEQPSNYKALAILLSKNIDISKLKELLTNQKNVYVIDDTKQISKIFGHYKSIISYVLIGVIFLLWIGLVLRYGFKKSLIYILVPILSCLSSIAILGIFDIPFTLFSILATILVLGISMDYVLFLAESHDHKFNSTMLALSLSAITTVLTFGLLSLSSTPAIEYFGITALTGITLAFILSPIVTKVTHEQ